MKRPLKWLLVRLLSWCAPSKVIQTKKRQASSRAVYSLAHFKVPLRHCALHVSGNSVVAAESFPASDHGGKYGVSGVLTCCWWALCDPLVQHCGTGIGNLPQIPRPMAHQKA